MSNIMFSDEQREAILEFLQEKLNAGFNLEEVIEEMQTPSQILPSLSPIDD